MRQRGNGPFFPSSVFIDKWFECLTRIINFHSFNAHPGAPVGFAFSFSLEGSTGPIFRTGACLLPCIVRFTVLSGELYIPNTSASAGSFVLMVIVGSPVAAIMTLFRLAPEAVAPIFCVDLDPSSLNFTLTGPADESQSSDAADGHHFLPRRPIERARTSAAEYSTPEGMNNNKRLNRSFSGRLPGAGGGASMGAYRA